VKILVVEDEPILREGLVDLLTGAGHRVEAVADGASGLDRGSDPAFDLVLLDIMMPEMNGYEVLEHLRADGRLVNLPVIVISALSDIDSVVRCVELGAEDYLTKPFNATLLRARISAVLEKKRLRDEASRHAAARLTRRQRLQVRRDRHGLAHADREVGDAVRDVVPLLSAHEGLRGAADEDGQQVAAAGQRDVGRAAVELAEAALG